MKMRQSTVIALFCLLHAVAYATAIGTYSVIGPGTIRSNFKYNVAVSAHKSDGPCQMEVGITGPSYNATKTIELQPMETKEVEFDLPALANGDYNLTAKGLSGIVFENSTKLNYADYKPSTFIQTDKATYKPGDLVHFRVLFLDQNARPASLDKPITVLINDGAQNRIKQLSDVKLTTGVYTGEFQLSEQPVLGDWNIEVLVDGESYQKKNFEVAKYVLPKFEVSIDAAKDVAIPDDVIKATVRAKYTYGKSVKGKATVSIAPAYSYYSDLDRLNAIKTIDVDGKGHVEFSISKDLHLSTERSYIPPMKIFAIMEEELTGNKQNATATVNLHAERYRIKGIDTPYTYYPGKPVTYKIAVQNLDGTPVRDTKNKVKLIVDPSHSYFYRDYIAKPDMLPLELEANLNELGIATFEFSIPENNHTYFSVKCKFLDTSAYMSSISKFVPSIEVPEPLKITVNTKEPQLGKSVSVEVKSNQPIPYFVYTIVARGNIMKSEFVNVPEGRKAHTVKFMPTFEMVPRASFYIHYVLDNNLRFEETAINFEKTFENKINITAPAQAKPGEEVSLKIVTDPESFVGLLGVDQSVLLLKSGNDLTKDQIFDSLNVFDTNTPWMRGYGRYPGQTSGVVTMTNANYPYNDDLYVIRPLFSLGFAPNGIGPSFALAASFMPGPPQNTAHHTPPVRKEFPENWIFQNIENGDTSDYTIAKKIPDTITSWVVTGFSLNPKTGFALTENPSKVQVFQPFFISTNLPYSVKRGEVIAIPVIIFNYMDKALDAEVTMDNTDQEFEFTEATNEIVDNPINEIKRVKRVTVPSSSGKSVSFMIRPKKVGPTTLKITAITPLAGDAIHQTLKVEPEGVTQYENRAIFVNLKDKPEQSEKLSVDVPSAAVPDSEFIEFSVVGDILGPTIKNLDKLVRMPYGCGEQNMVNFVPNILVLKYLETINRNMPTIIEKAKKFLEIGYQRELTYKHDDGSYSAFGKSDPAGSTWLTAYVMRSFHQAKNYTDIDPKVIDEGLDFLASKQAENGSFPEYGKLFDSAHQNELGLTSFVLLAFFENEEHIPKYQAQIDKGIKYVADAIDKTDDEYSLAIAALALQLHKNPLADKVLTKLRGLATQENDLMWWGKKPENAANTPAWYWRPQSKNVEITSYILLALLEKESAQNVLPIVKWMISQRNSNGGFTSTQDTVVGLQALIKFAYKTGSGNGQMTIDFVSQGNEENKGSFNVNPDNSLLLQTHVLPKSTRKVDFKAKGTGSSIVQLSYRYNLAEKDKKPSFEVKTAVKDNTPPKQLVVDICTKYVPLEEANKDKDSNMAVLEVALPSGYTADTDSFDKIQSAEGVKRTETKNSDSTVIVYFDGLKPGKVICVPVEASKTHAVAKQKPAPVTIYDYYDTNRRATEYYDVRSSLCDICEGDDCGTGCAKN